MSFLERWNSVRSACFARLSLAGLNPASLRFEDTVKPTTPEQVVQRFEHYELVTGEDGKPVELGRGAMGVTYKAFDVDLRCPVTLKVISDDISATNRRGFGSCARHARRPASVTRMLPRSSTWAERARITSTRWSL